MSKTILQINYKFNSSRADYEAMVTPSAGFIAATPELVWKVWLMNEAEHEAGGIYLFESSDAAHVFVNSPAITGFFANPSLSAVNTKLFEPDEALSKVTRGPLTIPVSA